MIELLIKVVLSGTISVGGEGEGSIATIVTSSLRPTPELGSSERPIKGELGTDFLRNGFLKISTRLDDPVKAAFGSDGRFGGKISAVCKTKEKQNKI